MDNSQAVDDSGYSHGGDDAYFSRHLSTPKLAEEWLVEVQKNWHEFQLASGDKDIDSLEPIKVLAVLHKETTSFTTEVLFRVRDSEEGDQRMLYVYDMYDPGTYWDPPEQELYMAWDCCPLSFIRKIPGNRYALDENSQPTEFLTASGWHFKSLSGRR